MAQFIALTSELERLYKEAIARKKNNGDSQEAGRLLKELYEIEQECMRMMGLNFGFLTINA